MTKELRMRSVSLSDECRFTGNTLLGKIVSIRLAIVLQYSYYSAIYAFQTIKILQQRYNDLRKTLQREFHASIPKDLNQLGSSKTSNTGSPPSPKSLPLVHYDTSATSQSDVDVAKRASTTRQMTAVRKTVTFISNSPSSSSSTAGASDSSAILPHTTAESKSQRNGHRSSVDGQSTANGTNFKYLKHVLLKFMTSTEDEVR